MRARLGVLVSLAALSAAACGADGARPAVAPGPGVRAEVAAVVHVFPYARAGAPGLPAPQNAVHVAIYFEVADPGPAPIGMLTLIPPGSWWDRHDVVPARECHVQNTSPNGRLTRSIGCGAVNPGAPVTVALDTLTGQSGDFTYVATVWDAADADRPVAVRRPDGSPYRVSWEEVIPEPPA